MTTEFQEAEWYQRHRLIKILSKSSTTEYTGLKACYTSLALTTRVFRAEFRTKLNLSLKQQGHKLAAVLLMQI